MSKYLELVEGSFTQEHLDKQKKQNPYVAYSVKDDKAIYTKIPNYLCLEPIDGNNQLALLKLGDFSNIKYSFDKKNWNNFPVDSNNPFNITYITVDKPVYLRGYNLNGVINSDETQGCKLTGLGKYNVSGDITTLLNIAGDVRDLTPYGNYGVFSYLFGEFNGVRCVDIVDASKLILPATTLVDNCYYQMFSYCPSLTTAPELPATTLAEYCYFDMFRNCSKLNRITCLATDISANACTSNWVNKISSTGTFVKHPSMNGWPTGIDGIPSGWTVEDAVL